MTARKIPPRKGHGPKPRHVEEVSVRGVVQAAFTSKAGTDNIINVINYLHEDINNINMNSTSINNIN